ncbi:TetR/AcrR family transcriptional regulator [Rhodococcus sp. C26F]
MSTPAVDVHGQPVVEEPPKRRSQKERRTLTERALVEAARRLVARRGVDQTSVADIGEEAGYSRGSVNHRFGSKTALLQRLARDTQQSVEDIFRDRGRTPLESMIILVQVYFEWVRDREDDARAFYAMWGAAVPDESVLREVFVEFDEHTRRRFESMIRSGQAEGTVRADVDPVGVAVALVGLVRGIAAQCLVTPLYVDLDVARTAAEQFIRRMLEIEPT